jgi:hypothetical protein
MTDRQPGPHRGGQTPPWGDVERQIFRHRAYQRQERDDRPAVERDQRRENTTLERGPRLVERQLVRADGLVSLHVAINVSVRAHGA